MNAPANPPVIPESAPFSAEQRYWLNGFLAGISSVSAGASAPTPPAEAAAPRAGTPLLILYGSQSGNTEGMAHALAEKLQARVGGPVLSPRVVAMDRFSEIDFAAEKYILLACSTWGDGDMPDNAASFWEWLQSDKAPSLPNTAYAVLGLGDRNYRRFCQSGKSLDARFAELGARRLRPLCECDTDFEAKAAEWMDAVWTLLEAELPAGPAASGGAPSPAAPVNGHAPSAAAASRYDKKNPFPAALLENRPLNARESAKDTRHLAFSLVGSGLEYKAGDALGVYPLNDFDLADRLILRLNCSGSEKIVLPWGEESTLRSALLEKLSLHRSSAKLLEALLQSARNPGERMRLQDLLADPESAETQAYLASHDVLDTLDDFFKTHPDMQAVVSALSRLTPRLYSIASSPKAHPGEVHLCLSVVRQQLGGRLRRGVASTYLAERIPLGMAASVFIQPAAHFGVPEKPGTPVIMVGPGTGIAPFRAFLEERWACGDPGKNWLFFGDQKKSLDYLYASELEAMQREGFLTRLDLAFSRDQEEKVYVQDRMLENAAELFAWLEEGAHFYVCGDAKRMAKDVDAALHRIIVQEGGRSEDEAKEYVEKLKREKRYGRDVY
ncbi:MAG: sulfite reductase flavoprotein alpha chain [Fibrobacteria bacterium]|jgi:sulfite reductase (NADPH) flavoprotein alpha-component|nr:sulfite reductase flavoprotein alpha chain [Fibrobacteria bacterium]